MRESNDFPSRAGGLHVVLLTAGSPATGAGHVIRSLALADEAVRSGHHVTFVGRFEGAFVRGQLEAAGVEVVDLPDGGASPTLSDVLAARSVDVVHVDSYHLDVTPADLSASGARLVSNVEDGPFGRRPAGLTVDPTVGAESLARPAGPGLVCRGARFAPLRRRILDQRGRTSVRPEAERVLVMMGGTDASQQLPRVLRLLEATRLPLDVTAIVPAGAAVPTSAGLLRINATAPTDDIARLMVTHDLVVSAAGTSATELMCLGVPTALVCVADNQRIGYARAVREGGALGLGDSTVALDEVAAAATLRRALLDDDLRRRLAETARGLVDGLGSWRVVRTWEQLVAEPPAATPAPDVAVRPVTEQDAELLLVWRNDPGTRAASIGTEEVGPDAHRRWLAASLQSDDRLLLVGTDARGPVGTVRWDRVAPDEWEVSLTVAPERRGEGLARGLLSSGEDALCRREEAPVTLLARVKPDNVPSLRLFAAAGYTADLPVDEGGLLRLLRQPFHEGA